MADTNKERLDRIESKLDQMAEVVVSLARVEEKLQASEEVRPNALTRMNRFSEKLDEIEKVCDSNHATIKVINKVVWLISAAVIAGIVQSVLDVNREILMKTSDINNLGNAYRSIYEAKTKRRSF